jgi:hypothetical protein
MAQVGGNVGIQGPLIANLSDAPFSMDKQGAMMVSTLAARYYNNAYFGNVFGAYAAGVATSLAGTAMVGLQIWNGSSGSTAVNIVLTRVSGFIAVTSASTTGLVIATGTGQTTAPTSTTAVTRSGSNFIGSAYASKVTAYNAGTFVNAPTALIPVMHNTAAIATTGEDPGYQVDIDGGLIIGPNCYAAMAALGAAGAASSCFHYMQWIEVPV